MKYYAIHTHLHCSHEPSASIDSHMSHCKELGIAYMWTTEHDTRMGKKKRNIPSFSFQAKELYTTLENGRNAGFSEEENSGNYEFLDRESGFDLLIQASAGEKESLYFHSQGKAHTDPLFSRLSVEMKGDINVKAGGQVRVEFILSAQPPTYKQARLCYVLGEIPTEIEGSPVQYLPFPEKKDGGYNFVLYKDVDDRIGGIDNALCNIRLVAQNGGEIVFQSIVFHRELNFNEVRKEQIKLATELSKKWGVTAFVGFEITGAGNHKNCFSTKVPVINYSDLDYSVTNEQAIEHVKSHGGIFSWNHPFTRVLKLEMPQEEIFEKLAEELIETRVYGASLMEVGFPMGRDKFESKDYLRLWDRLSENGIMITGNGDSDNHHATENGWTTGNNFCSFAGFYDDEEPTEEGFVRSFQRGTLWGGNPVVMRNLSFTGNGKEQGSLIRGGQVRVEFSSTDIQCGGYAVAITNGKEVKRMPIVNGEVSGEWILSCEKKYNFARLEIYNEEDILIAFSNPIYLVDEKTEIKER